MKQSEGVVEFEGDLRRRDRPQPPPWLKRPYIALRGTRGPGPDKQPKMYRSRLVDRAELRKISQGFLRIGRFISPRDGELQISDFKFQIFTRNTELATRNISIDYRFSLFRRSLAKAARVDS